MKRAGWFDALKQEFPVILEAMPRRMQNRFLQALTQDHMIPADRRAFVSMLDDLREYRHWLEHYSERVAHGMPQPVSDIRLLDILGLMLLPHMGNQLLGRIHHHGRKSGLRGYTRVKETAKIRLDAALAKRRETSRYMNGLKRKSDHASVKERLTRKYGNPPGDVAVHRIAKEDAKKRRDLEHRKASLIALHNRYFSAQTWPRYNLENFLLRYAFIGKRRIGEIEKLLSSLNSQAAIATPSFDFVQDIEPAFLLSMDIGLIIHTWLSELEEAGINIRAKKVVGPIIPALRNEIAHGGWIWRVVDPQNRNDHLRFGVLIKALTDLSLRPELSGGGELSNQLLTRIGATLRPCADHLVYAVLQPRDDPNRHPPPYRIRRWTPANRAKYADNSLWRIERRPALRRLAALWMREIHAVRSGKI